MNVIDKYKDWAVDLIRQDVQKQTLPYSVCMVNINYDFNQATLIRNANAFGARNVFYLSDRRRYDRRGTCGQHWYTNVEHLKNIDELIKYKSYWTNFVAIENNVERKLIQVNDFDWQPNTMVIFGSEGIRLSDEILDLCDSIVTIPQIGSTRSLNVGCASAIILHDIMRKLSVI